MYLGPLMVLQWGWSGFYFISRGSQFLFVFGHGKIKKKLMRTEKAQLVVKIVNRSGEKKQYVYTSIKGCSVSNYMYERLKQARKKKRQEKGKMLFCEIPKSDVLEIQKKWKQGVSISSIAKVHQLSRYFVCKAIKEPSHHCEGDENTLCSQPASCCQ